MARVAGSLLLLWFLVTRRYVTNWGVLTKTLLTVAALSLLVPKGKLDNIHCYWMKLYKRSLYLGKNSSLVIWNFIYRTSEGSQEILGNLEIRSSN